MELVDDHEAMIKSPNWPASASKLNATHEENQKDSLSSAEIDYTLKGWPKYAKDLPEELRDLPHAHFSVTNGILLYDDRIAILRKLQDEMLERIHHGHMGISKSRERANQCIYWLRTSHDIADYVNKCKHCQINQPSQHKESLQTSAPPFGIWKCVVADLLSLKNVNYLEMIDYYSKYIEISHLPNKTSTTVINEMKAIIARWGIPDTIMSDNSPEFASQEFAQFSHTYGFEHVTSSSRYTQANGMAESAVKITKPILQQEDPY